MGFYPKTRMLGRMTFTTCDLFDDDETLQSVSLQFENLGAHPRFSGPIRTVRCYRDNGLVKSLLNSPAMVRCWWLTEPAHWNRH